MSAAPRERACAVSAHQRYGSLLVSLSVGIVTQGNAASHTARMPAPTHAPSSKPLWILLSCAGVFYICLTTWAELGPARGQPPLVPMSEYLIDRSTKSFRHAVSPRRRRGRRALARPGVRRAIQRLRELPAQ